tara:strand:+ start:207 stop:443 length:237 start_codon:yes stop_codon:yes gene_type:complete
MKRIIINFLVIFIININTPFQVKADKNLDFYMNDFYTKSNEASLILKEIENDLKLGIKKKIVLGRKKQQNLEYLLMNH